MAESLMTAEADRQLRDAVRRWNAMQGMASIADVRDVAHLINKSILMPDTICCYEYDRQRGQSAI